MKNTKSFQERFNRWKNGENYWDIVGKPLREQKSEEQTINQEERDYLDSIVTQYERGKDSVIQNTISYNQWRESLPDNLKKETSDYDLYGAYKAGMEPRLEDDGYYHLGSRDPKTGRILKLPQHPTYLKALNEDAKLGYFPIKSKNGYTYTDTWKGNNPGYAKYDTGKPSNQQQVFRGDKTGQYFNENNEPLYIIDDNQSNNDPRTWTFGDYNGKVYNPIITNWDLEKERVAQQINDIEKNNSRRNNIANTIGEITSNIPLVGDVKDVLVTTKGLYNKQYAAAGLGLAALLLPNVIEKPLKSILRFTKRSIRKPINTVQDAANASDANWDYLYNKALEQNNIEELQKLRNLHFLSKAPNTKIIDSQNNPIPIFHGTEIQWNPQHQYNTDMFGTATDDGYYGIGLYGSADYNHARQYGNIIKSYYVNSKNPFVHGMIDNFDEANKRAGVVRWFNRDRSNVKFDESYTNQLQELDKADATIYKFHNSPIDEIVTPYPEQIKYADAITFDDFRKPIPLSKRDNFLNKDMRYLLPFPILTYGIYNGINSNQQTNIH